MSETPIGSVLDNDGDKADLAVNKATVLVYIRDEPALSLPPSRARALAAILNSAADVAEGQGR